jgi:hypothetical protein
MQFYKNKLLMSPVPPPKKKQVDVQLPKPIGHSWWWYVVHTGSAILCLQGKMILTLTVGYVQPDSCLPFIQMVQGISTSRHDFTSSQRPCTYTL